MNAKAIVVTSGKGGVGKTTTTANVGSALAQLGEKVAVLDLDVGLRNLDSTMGMEGRIVFDIIDVLEGRCKLRQALIRHKHHDSLYLLPASQTRDKDALNKEAFIKLVEQLFSEEGFDRVLIDSAAGIEHGSRTAMAPAHGALVVVNAEVSSIRDADRIIGLLESNGISNNYLVVNRLRPKMVEQNDMLSIADVQEVLALKLIGIVPEDEKVVVSINKGQPLVFGDLSEQPLGAGQAFVDIARRIRGEEVPFPDLSPAPAPEPEPQPEAKGLLAAIARLFGGR